VQNYTVVDYLAAGIPGTAGSNLYIHAFSKPECPGQNAKLTTHGQPTLWPTEEEQDKLLASSASSLSSSNFYSHNNNVYLAYKVAGNRHSKFSGGHQKMPAIMISLTTQKTLEHFRKKGNIFFLLISSDNLCDKS
jgi:hypothetical protein